jgi:mRNA-degrading endonuclease RelE of RelBE toxin-antitoxin system
MFDNELAPEAEKDLKWFRKAEQVRIIAEIEKQLRDQPDVETRNRKRLRPDHVTEWELRIGHIRVFYDVDLDACLVRIAAIGYKERNKLFFRGQEYQS